MKVQSSIGAPNAIKA